MRTIIPVDGKCLDCRSILKDEFPDIHYVGCDGCPRVYAREPTKECPSCLGTMFLQGPTPDEIAYYWCESCEGEYSVTGVLEKEGRA